MFLLLFDMFTAGFKSNIWQEQIDLPRNLDQQTGHGVCVWAYRRLNSPGAKDGMGRPMFKEFVKHRYPIPHIDDLVLYGAAVLAKLFEKWILVTQSS